MAADAIEIEYWNGRNAASRRSSAVRVARLWLLGYSSNWQHIGPWRCVVAWHAVWCTESEKRIAHCRAKKAETEHR